MMQMQEIEKLRRTLEKHVSRYLDIRWSIPALQVRSLLGTRAVMEGNVARWSSPGWFASLVRRLPQQVGRPGGLSQ